MRPLNLPADPTARAVLEHLEAIRAGALQLAAMEPRVGVARLWWAKAKAANLRLRHFAKRRQTRRG